MCFRRKIIVNRQKKIFFSPSHFTSPHEFTTKSSYLSPDLRRNRRKLTDLRRYLCKYEVRKSFFKSSLFLGKFTMKSSYFEVDLRRIHRKLKLNLRRNRRKLVTFYDVFILYKKLKSFRYAGDLNTGPLR